MDANELSDELKAKLLECKSTAEILQLAQDEGYELSDEQLDSVSGGWLSCGDYGCGDNNGSLSPC